MKINLDGLLRAYGAHGYALRTLRDNLLELRARHAAGDGEAAIAEFFALYVFDSAQIPKGGGLSCEGDAVKPLATEETGSDRPAAPIHRGDQCPSCATGAATRAAPSGLRCVNCGWTGPDPDSHIHGDKS